MDDSLHQEPERDQFKSESPIRAFTGWHTSGNYALGKGFRPSLQHVVPYLDAMERKEGWRLVQVLEAGTQTPSFLFRLEGGPSDEEILRRFDHLDLTGAGIKPREPTPEWLTPMFTIRKVATGLRQVSAEMRSAIAGTTWPTKRKNQFYAFSDRANGYAAELEAELELVAPYVAPLEAPYGRSEQFDFGAPHGVPLLILMESGTDKPHESSGAFIKGQWHVITHMFDAENWRAEPMRGAPIAWREGPSDLWSACDIYAEIAKGITVERTEVGGHLAFKITHDTETIKWNRAKWNGNPEVAMRAIESMMPELRAKFMRDHKVDSVAHFWRTASVAAVLRLIDKLGWWDRVSLADPITVHELGKVLGRKFLETDPALMACNTNVEKALRDFYGTDLGETHQPKRADADDDFGCEHERPYLVEDDQGTRQIAYYSAGTWWDGDNTGGPDRQTDHPIVKVHSLAIKPIDWTDHASDEDIPAEHHEDALRFIADKRGMDADRLVRDFMLYFKPENQSNQLSHKTFASQLQFILPMADPVELKRLTAWFRSRKALQATVAEQMKRGDTVDVKLNIATGQVDVKRVEPEATSAREDDIVERVDLQGRVLDRIYAESGRRVGDSDDPINPKHYNGRECADIGERLSANGYQVLKYVWRLGKKDDPCIEIGKAIWYCESEMALLKRMRGITTIRPNMIDIKPEHIESFLEDRIADQPMFTQNIARMLWQGYSGKRLQAIHEALTEHRFHLDCGRGLAI